MKDCIRCVLAKESTVLTVCGPASWFALYEKGARRRAESKLAYVDGELLRFCRKLGVHYLQLDGVPGSSAEPDEYLANRLHAAGNVHARRSEAEGRAMARAWQLAHTEGH